MKNLRKRITAILMALIQMLTLVSPGIATAEDEIYNSGEVNRIGDHLIYYMSVEADNQVLSGLADLGYYIVVKQDTGEPGPRGKSFAIRPFSQITKSGFQGFEDFIGNNGTRGASESSTYQIKILKPD